MSTPSSAFRRLASWTAVATFLLIVLGGVVRVSESGLGCGPGGSGTRGWPLCRGDLVPGFSLHTGIEYAHRAVASILVVEMLVLAVVAWRRYRAHRSLVRATRAGADGVAAVDGGRRFRPLAMTAQTLLLGTIVAGGYVAGTEHLGRSD